jgi:hypothetical protein
MPKVSEYVQGTPNWVDLQTTDQGAAKEFYSSLFGWSYNDQAVPGGGAVYSMALVNGDAVAAIAPMPPGAPGPTPPMWNTYLAVDDVDATVEKVGPAGGQVLMPPTDIGDAGRMAFVTDPTGAAIGLWHANRHIGATLVNETGAVIWNELLTEKPDAALPFYEAVVDVSHASMEMAPVTSIGSSRLAARMSAAARSRRCRVCPTTGRCTSPWTTPMPSRRRPPLKAAR